MIALIEKIFGSAAGRLIAEVLFALIAISALVLHFEHKGATEELGKLKASSIDLVEKLDVRNALDYDKYQAATAANEEKLNENRQLLTAMQSQLVYSVRGFDAYRRAHPGVARPAGADGAAVAGECGSEDCGAVAERLAVRGNELAGSTGALSADMQSCQRDRDALTGQPK